VLKHHTKCPQKIEPNAISFFQRHPPASHNTHPTECPQSITSTETGLIFSADIMLNFVECSEPLANKKFGKKSEWG
jgi:hypothetical protein